ncbi:aquaporin [Kitasatospora paracochleata]|uniref:Glycerol uptake facilitator-like aquaporin n=1 Tax=Kitasatospora paracochleata TaxID=58354 RepID=A0ABT1J6G9_9ACTN|nr:aquaporin [Kitasatospora paracochleata]MCP2313032.1 glycerol uptake facilitator-like aquaporin [Kitasatospora paracochleata]
MMTTPLPRRLAAEAVGTAVLAAVLVGSGIQASGLSPDGGVRFLANVLASVLALAVLIALLAPVSGAHFNPLVSAADWWSRRHDPAGPSARELGLYVLAQLGGAAAGVGLANAMFERPFVQLASQQRSSGHLWLAEGVATGVLILLVLGLLRSGRGRYAPVAVAAWIGAACWGTSSGSFANPALTFGRALSDSYTGIAPGSVPGFVLAQTAGATIGLALATLLFGAPLPAAAAGRDSAQAVAAPVVT